MGADKSLADGKAQTCSGGEARKAVIHAVKPFKDEFALALRDTRSIIEDLEYKVAIFPAYLYVDLRFFTTVLDGILDQVS